MAILIQIVDCNDRNRYNYLTISQDFKSFSYDNSAIHLDENNYIWIQYQELNTFDSIDIDGTGTQTVEWDGTGTTVCIGDTILSMYSEDNKSLNLTGNGITGDLTPKSITSIVKATEDGNSSDDYVINLEQTGYFKFDPVEGKVDVSVGDNERYAAVEASGISDVEFVTGNNININGSGSNYSAYVSDPSNKNGLIRISDDNSSNTKVEQTADGIIVKNDNNIDSLQVETIKTPYSAVEQLTVSTNNKEVLIKDKPDDDTGACQLLVSEKSMYNVDIIIKKGHCIHQ